MVGFFKKSCLALLCAVLVSAVPGVQASETMLMFVGEDLEVLSIASRKEEAAWKAPAVADVVLRREFEKTGADTIAEVLDTAAGFHVSQTEKGSVPFLRGVPDSALILHDTVPIASGANKSLQYMDYETSLAAIKRVEIVRGAGSVLWGPDAFAGVVNVVPMTGKDLDGTETGARISVDGSSENRGSSGFAYANHGVDHGEWNAFFSLAGGRVKADDSAANVVRFWQGDDQDGAVAPRERFGETDVDDSRYVELYANASFKEWLTLSARITDNENSYSVSDWSGDHVWQENRSAPSQTFKIEASRDTGLNSALRFTGYYTRTVLDHEIIDRSFDQSEETFYGELIHESAFFASKGLLTSGVSWRETAYDDIPVWKGFMPDYLTEENQNPGVLPEVEKKGYSNRLYSVFGQYRHDFDAVELWAGARGDFHDKFPDKTSFSLGAAYNLSPSVILKAIYGTAYRTPFAKQVAVLDDIELEKMENINFQAIYKPGKENKIALTLFRNGIENHVIEDPYAGAGLSTPNSQTIYGAELECDYRLSKAVLLSSNLTLLANAGSDETWRYVDYYIDGEPVYDSLEYDYNTGADTVFNLSLSWDITEKITITPKLDYFSERVLYSPKENREKTCDAAWLMDMNVRVKDLFPFDLYLYMENIADTDYHTPGTYSLIKGKPFKAGFTVKMQW